MDITKPKTCDCPKHKGKGLIPASEFRVRNDGYGKGGKKLASLCRDSEKNRYQPVKIGDSAFSASPSPFSLSGDPMEHNKDLDQFFTNPKVALDCAKSIKKHSNPDFIIEPSAGDGALLDAVKQVFPGVPTWAGDIDPKREDIAKADFLKVSRPAKDAKRTLVYANPPFGRRSSLAIRFFNHAAGMADTLAFIIPVQFRKWSVQSKLNADFKLVLDVLLPEAAFVFNGKPYSVRCCFQIWKRDSDIDLRIQAPLPTSHPDFDMWQYNNTEGALHVFDNRFDFAVPRQGYQDYTRRETKESACERTTQWVLFRARNPQVLARLKRLDFQKLAARNTTTPGFGKADIVKFYKEVYE